MTESPADPGRSDLPVAYSDPVYLAAVIDLLGAIAYGEMSAFERLSEDAKMAPGLPDKAELARMASTEFAHFEGLSHRLAELGADPFEAMSPFVAPFDAFHRAYGARGLARGAGEGLCRGRAGRGLLHARSRRSWTRTPARSSSRASPTRGSPAFVVDRVRKAIAAEPRLGGRLALWGRRLMGEALSQAQRVAAERDALTALLAGGVDRPGLDLAAIGRLFTRLTENHAKRMEALGLAA